jgi:hypothetical protein
MKDSVGCKITKNAFGKCVYFISVVCVVRGIGVDISF